MLRISIYSSLNDDTLITLLIFSAINCCNWLQSSKSNQYLKKKSLLTILNNKKKDWTMSLILLIKGKFRLYMKMQAYWIAVLHSDSCYRGNYQFSRLCCDVESSVHFSLSTHKLRVYRIEMENFLNKKYKFDRADEHFNDYLIGIGEYTRCAF